MTAFRNGYGGTYFAVNRFDRAKRLCSCAVFFLSPRYFTWRSGFSRPALMQGVAREVLSSGQCIVKISLMNEKSQIISVLVACSSKQLPHMKLITERWSSEAKWSLILTRLLRRWLGR